jgi:predicted dehydrogenase
VGRTRLAIVGLGRWGLNYCRTLARLPGGTVAAVVDPRPEARDAAAAVLGPGCARLSDMSDLCVPDLDAAVIATPESSHFELARRCLNAGLHVLVEKPMAASSADATELARLADGAGRVLAVGHTSLYGLGYDDIRRACTDVRAITACRASRGLAGVPPTPAAVLWDLAPHDIAMAVMLAGEPVSASCRAASRSSVAYELRFAGGATMSGSAAWQPEPARGFKVITAGGTLDAREPLDGAVPFGDLPLTRQCRDFLAACRGASPVLSDARLGLATVRTVETLAAQLP